MTSNSYFPFGSVAVLVDPINGSDSYGRRFGPPFATLGGARSAAGAGDTIFVLPGTYNETNLAKHLVHWFFLPGAKVTYTGSSYSSLFDDSALGTAADLICTVGGYGEFTHSGGSGAGAAEFGCFLVTRAGSAVTVKCQSCRVTKDDTNTFAVTLLLGALSIECESISAAISGGAVAWKGGTFHVTAKTISTDAGGLGAYTIWGSDPGVVSEMFVTANLISNPIYAAIALAGVSADFKLWVNAKEIVGKLGGVTSASIHVTGGKLYVSGLQKLSSIATCGLYMTGGEVWIEAQKFTCDLTSSAVANGFPQHIKITGGTLYADVKHFETVGAVNVGNGCELNGGLSYIRGQQMKILNGAGITTAGGFHDVFGMRIDTSTTNTATNYPVLLTAYSLVLRNCWLVCPGAVVSIFAASAKSVQCFGSAATNAVHANVTQVVQGVTVNGAVG